MTADDILHDFRLGDYVVPVDDRLDHAARVDRIVWSVWLDVTYLNGWRAESTSTRSRR